MEYKVETVTVPNGSLDKVGVISKGLSGSYQIKPVKDIKEKCVFSIYIYGISKFILTIDAMGSVSENEIKVGWQRLVINIDNPSNEQDKIILYPQTDNNFYIYHAQLEKGNVVTDWTESPEDVEEFINKNIEIVTNIVNEVKQTADSNSASIKKLETKVETVEDLATGNKSDITTIQTNVSSVQQDLNSFKTNVSQTYQTKDEMSGYYTSSQVDSQIVQKTDGITQSISKLVSEQYVNKNDYNKTTSELTTVKATLDGFKTDVSKIYATKESVEDLENDLVTNYSNTEQMNSAINQSANSIKSTVAYTYATNENLNTLNNILVKNYTTTRDMNSIIDQKADSITSTVTASVGKKVEEKADELSDKIDENVKVLSSEIKQNTDAIELRVIKDDIISSINQSAEKIAINASKIDLNGIVTANNNFKILKDGSMQAINAVLSGKVNANSGKIAGFDINNKYLVYKENTANYIVFDADNQTLEIASCGENQRRNLLDNTHTFGSATGTRKWTTRGFSKTTFNANGPLYLDGGTYLRSNSSDNIAIQSLNNAYSYTNNSPDEILFSDKCIHTFSFYYKTDVKASATIGEVIDDYTGYTISGAKKSVDLLPTEGNWVRTSINVYGYHRTINNTQKYSFAFKVNLAGVSVCGFKLERGILASSWVRSTNDTGARSIESVVQINDGNIFSGIMNNDKNQIACISKEGYMFATKIYKGTPSSNYLSETKIVIGNEHSNILVYNHGIYIYRFDYNSYSFKPIVQFDVDGIEIFNRSSGTGYPYTWEEVHKALGNALSK